MWKETRRFIMLALLAASCLCFSSVAYCSEAVAGTEEDMILVSRKDWNELKQNNAEQRKALNALLKELLEARAARSESDQALNEAKALLEASQMTSSEVQEKLIQLLTESRLQKEEISKLKNDLAIAKNESLSSYESIMKANQYLVDTKKEIEAREAEWRKRENQLERQRLEWQILFALAVCGGVAVAR